MSLPLLILPALATPPCLKRAEGQTTQQVLMAVAPEDREILARLVYAEATSTERGGDPRVHFGIAWGAMNRVRLAERSPSAARSYGRGVAGVVFQKGQFNPAVSARSRFADELLCPADHARWGLALAAAATALAGEGNPFLQTEWERESGLSLVVNFYYPASVQARGPHAPWENDGSLVFIGDVPMMGGTLSADAVRFYRLARPPRDVTPGPPP